MTQLPTAVPNVLPEGEYKFEITDVQQFPSTFDKGSYWKMYFLVQNKDGEHFDFACTIKPKMQRFHDILAALKIRPDDRGFVTPPDNVIGMEFTGELIQRQAQNDKTKMMNDMRNLHPVIKKEKKKEDPDNEARDDEAFERELSEELPESMK